MTARVSRQDARIARLILINGPPASGKSTLARRYVATHDHASLVDVDSLRMSLPDWETDEATRLAARDHAGAEVVQHLGAGRDVVMGQYFGRLGYIVLLEDLARVHGATFVEVILAMDAVLAIDRFRTRRQVLTERDEHHPERDIADADVEAFILDAVERLTRLPTARPESRIIRVEAGTSEDVIDLRLCSVLGETDQPQPPHRVVSCRDTGAVPVPRPGVEGRGADD